VAEWFRFSLKFIMEVMFLPWLSVSGMTQKLDEFCRMFLEVVLASDC